MTEKYQKNVIKKILWNCLKFKLLKILVLPHRRLRSVSVASQKIVARIHQKIAYLKIKTVKIQRNQKLSKYCPLVLSECVIFANVLLIQDIAIIPGSFWTHCCAVSVKNVFNFFPLVKRLKIQRLSRLDRVGNNLLCAFISYVFFNTIEECWTFSKTCILALIIATFNKFSNRSGNISFSIVMN